MTQSSAALWGGITEQERSILVREGFWPCDLVSLLVGELAELLGTTPSGPLLTLRATQQAGHRRLLDAPCKGGLKRLVPVQRPIARPLAKVLVRVPSESTPSATIPFYCAARAPGCR